MGAVDYLSKSKYGLNTTNIAVNNITLNSGVKKRTEAAGQNEVDSVYAVTGCTTGSTNTGEQQKNKDDINGTPGYATVYPHDSTTDSTDITDTEEHLNTASMNNWLANKLIYGDAIRETSTTGTGTTSWYSDGSYFPGLYAPFSVRGGRFYGGTGAGLFCVDRNGGNSGYSTGFRAVVVVS